MPRGILADLLDGDDKMPVPSHRVSFRIKNVLLRIYACE
jgi:hypothetical protein